VIILSERLSVEKQRIHFESVAEEYYKARVNEKCLLFKELLWSYFFGSKRFEYFRKRNIAVLEPMCGYAEGKLIVSNYLSRNITYEGFDYSQNIIDIAKTINPDVEVHVQDVTTWNADKKYDVIIIIGGLHHVPDFAQNVLQRMYAALNYRGVLINFEPTHNFFMNRVASEYIYKKKANFDHETERRFSLSEINIIYRNAGFTISEQLYPGLLSYVLYANPNALPSLNKGSTSMLRLLFRIDRLFFKNLIGRKFSFSTLTLLEK